MITVEATRLGRPSTPIHRFQVPPWEPEPASGSPITLRDLITRIVREEVAAFRMRQLDNTFLRALTAQEIGAGAAAGAVKSGGSDLQQEVDDEVAVAIALQAFIDGIYFVILDGTHYRNLDEQVAVANDSTITFLRLVPLAGG